MSIFLMSLLMVSTEPLPPPELYSKDHIVASVVDETTGESAELRWGLTEDTYNSHRLFITVHGFGGGKPNQAAIYLEKDGEYKLVRQLKSEYGTTYFGEPKSFWHDKSVSGRHLIQITETVYGTAHSTTDHIFRVHSNGTVSNVQLISADQYFADKLKEGQGIWKGVMNRFSAEGLEFEFHVWNKGDSNCCPTGATIKGTYKMLSDPDRIVVDEYQVLPPAR